MLKYSLLLFKRFNQHQHENFYKQNIVYFTIFKSSENNKFEQKGKLLKHKLRNAIMKTIKFSEIIYGIYE